MLVTCAAEFFDFQFFFCSQLCFFDKIVGGFTHTTLQLDKWFFCCHRFVLILFSISEPMERIELSTFSLPWKCSATELHRRCIKPSVGAVGLAPTKGKPRQIYSLLPLLLSHTPLLPNKLPKLYTLI